MIARPTLALLGALAVAYVAGLAVCTADSCAPPAIFLTWNPAHWLAKLIGASGCASVGSWARFASLYFPAGAAGALVSFVLAGVAPRQWGRLLVAVLVGMHAAASARHVTPLQMHGVYYWSMRIVLYGPPVLGALVGARVGRGLGWERFEALRRWGPLTFKRIIADRVLLGRLALALVLLLGLSHGGERRTFGPLAMLFAHGAAWVLRLAGYGACASSVEGLPTVDIDAQSGVSVDARCTAVAPFSAFVVLIWSVRAGVRRNLRWCCLLAALVASVNVVRIAVVAGLLHRGWGYDVAHDLLNAILSGPLPVIVLYRISEVTFDHGSVQTGPQSAPPAG